MEKHANAPLANVADLLLDAICVVDAEGRYLYVNAAYERIFGYKPEEILGTRMIDLVHPDDRERTLHVVDEIMGGQPKPHFENRYVRKDGQVVHIMWSARWSEAEQARFAVARDITELKRIERVQAALYAISEAAFAAADLLTLFGHIHRIVGELLTARNLFVALLDENDMLDFPYFVDEYNQRPPPQRLDSDALSALVVRTGEALLLTPDNRSEVLAHGRHLVGRAALDWLGVPLRVSRGVIGALVVQTYAGDVRYSDRDKHLLQFVSDQVAAAIERKQIEARLHYVAHHDPLTELPNRDVFHRRLDDALARARQDGHMLALLYIDLDRFKPINDSYGHDVGDLLLREVAARLRRCVRESDTVSRLGGDEFAVLLEQISHPEDAAHIAAKICHTFDHPCVLGGHSLNIAASIGIALHPAHGSSRERLLRNADDAMYLAKSRGGNQFVTATAGTGNATGVDSQLTD
ncbi:bifunctional diguanylate cyclase/phosphodiesterase [Dyella sp. A6]|uniref:sensor domain-containing protein n=1 Tax=Dyella aluminiiresistens TaxID=3069105 RepID=UPI002E786510|nr:diguanylate cyclase [Dyella sp. A6]